MDRKAPRAAMAHAFYDYKCLLNIHTDRSIGSGADSIIVNAAKSASADFLIFTDLNLYHPISGVEGYQGKLLTLVGGKFNFMDSRLMTYSVGGEFRTKSAADTLVYFTDLLSQKHEAHGDSLVILNHPFKTGFSWVGEYPPGLDGFEILNLKTLSSQAWMLSKLSTLWSVFIYPFNPKLAFIRLFQEPSEELSLLDKLSTERTIFGFAGSEASARAIPLTNYRMKFPSYQKLFELASNHVMLQSELNDNYRADRKKIFEALKTGSFYMSLDILGDPKGFVAYIEDKSKFHSIGSKLKFTKGLSLRVQLPFIPTIPYEIIIYRNGERYFTSNDPEFNFEIKEVGVYRIQVRLSPTFPLPDAKRWLSWIYTNPFWIN